MLPQRKQPYSIYEETEALRTSFTELSEPPPSFSSLSLSLLYYLVILYRFLSYMYIVLEIATIVGTHMTPSTGP